MHKTRTKTSIRYAKENYREKREREGEGEKERYRGYREGGRDKRERERFESNRDVKGIER